MAHIQWIAGCLGVMLLYLAAERALRDRAHASIPIRVHVNGTRGKSTVTRLIWAALREAGIPAAAKTTGTAPRLLLPDGREIPWPRRGPANVLEQLRFLSRAHRAGATAIVAECMALRPALQWTSEHDMIRATIGVITNVRTDHTEVMGRTRAEIAASLAGTVPRGGVLVLGDAAPAGALTERAAALGTLVVQADPDPAAGGVAPWLAECRSIALAVCRQLGLPDEVARRGMERARPDPGAAATGDIRFQGRELPYIDATAANDPESLDLLLRQPWEGSSEGARRLYVFNHRADRPDRLLLFAEALNLRSESAPLFLTGDRPCRQLRHRLGTSTGGARFVPRARLAAALAEALPGVDAVVFCGNTRGLNVRHIVEEVSLG